MKSITFTPILDIQPEFYPRPAAKAIPEWYKKTDEYIGGKKRALPNGTVTETIKKCIPVFDAMTAGYIIPTPGDVWVEPANGTPLYTFRSLNLVSMHNILQGADHPANNGHDYPKWINPWGIRTPRGYSCLFIPPMHNPNKWFTVLPGVVDTDDYYSPVNFPFVLNDPNFEGLIPAGTPMVQVIPFKRDVWKHEIGDDLEAIHQNTTRLNHRWFNSYKTLFWTRKEFR